MPMLPVPDNILKEFEAVLEKKGIAKELRPDFKKWPDIFWISPPRIRSPKPVLNRCVCSSTSCGKKTDPGPKRAVLTAL